MKQMEQNEANYEKQEPGSAQNSFQDPEQGIRDDVQASPSRARTRVKQDISAQGRDMLATEDIGTLLRKFAVPSVIAMLVGALYNIVDQIFIGQGVGMLGNAATNVAFPSTTLSLAVALLLGIGAASNFNLEMGRGNPRAAAEYVGTTLMMMAIAGLFLTLVTQLFLEPLLALFGATEEVLPYARIYLRITALGFPFILFNSGGANLVRSDGSPRQSMLIMLSGAILNTILDPIFIFVLNWGIAGAAWATVLGQALSFALMMRYLRGYRSVAITRAVLRLNPLRLRNILKLGVASFFNQVSITLVQIVMNNTLRYYGALSVYGAEIPLASAGIVTKINMLIFAIVIGIAQGSQPILGYNYGARNYDRVKQTLRLSILCAMAISSVGFMAFQLFPHPIIALFGAGSGEYFRFATRYLRIFLLMIFITPIQPIAATFFTSIGKAGKGFFMSLTRQVLFLIPLVLLLPRAFGIEGVVYAGPIADCVAVLVTVVFLVQELRLLREVPDGEGIEAC